MSIGIRDIMGLTLHWLLVPSFRKANTITASIGMNAVTASIGGNAVTASVGVNAVTATKETRQ